MFFLERLNNLLVFICLCPLLTYQHFICTGPVKEDTHLLQMSCQIAQYKALHENLHVSDNAKCDDPENKDNKLYKIQPVLDHVRENCILEPTQ